MKLELIEHDKYNELVLGGDLTIANMGTLKIQMDKLFDTCKECKVSFIEIEDIDISLIQLLVSSYTTFDSKNIVLKLYGEVPEIFNNKCKESGFNNLVLPFFNEV